MRPPRSVAVVGGGWAGCAAAASLAAAGTSVTLFEASADLGGRARRLVLDLDGEQHCLDNGQHLLLGAYTATASLLSTLNVDIDAVVQRRPFELRFADRFRLQASRLPAPWHLVTALLGARGLSWTERVSIVGFLRGLRADGWRLAVDRDAAGWLSDHGQGARLVSRIWRPLGLAALNTPLEQASAQTLAHVLRDSLGASSEASMLWLPRANLSALLPDAVERFVLARGGIVRRGTRVASIAAEGGRFRLELAGSGNVDVQFADAVVYAAPPAQLGRIAQPYQRELGEALGAIAYFDYEPICTVYLKYPAGTGVPRGLVALRDDPGRGAYGQWAFDRGALDPANRGIIAVVISAHGPHEDESGAGLCESVARQLSRELGLPPARAGRAIVEKRATLAARPGLRRPSHATDVPGLALAGDWTAGDYPSTLEAAVRSGHAAAAHLLQ
jgi:squalene-associated FAD-dependent desaturase